MSLPGQRLAATLCVLWMLTATVVTAAAGPLPDSTWVALSPLPQQGGSAIFGLAVDPSNNQSLLAGSSTGALLKSSDGGRSWSVANNGKAPVLTIAFSPLTPGLVLAGTQGSGALVSHDGGATWAAASGLEGRTVKVFGFALALFAAGTDRGVYLSEDGATWTSAGLAGNSIDALAVEAIHAPVHLVAGSDSGASGASLSLSQSLDGGLTWSGFNPAISGTFAVKLASGPLPPTGNVRPLLVGTNAGLFQSTDNGATFAPLSGGDLLPSTDYTQVAFVTDHFDRFYAASDGGGSGSGGLWKTSDAGATFQSMNPPVASVTALAVSNDEAPILYVATFRPSDHAAELWALHDTGGPPLGPAGAASPGASGARTSSPSAGTGPFDFLRSPEVPYLALGGLALVLLLSAGVAHLRGRRR